MLGRMLWWRIKDLYAEFTDPRLYRLKGVPSFWAGWCAGWVRGTIWGVPLVSAAYLVAVSCTPAQAWQAVTGVASLVQAADQMHDMANEAAEQDTPEASHEILEEQLPEVLQAIDEALAELCAPEGLLEPEDKVCRHYRAYKADPED